MKNQEELLTNLRIIWNYLILNQNLQKADCILIFGGHDPSVSIHASKLYKENWASKIIISGGVTHDPKYYGLEKETIEAEALKIIALNNGVPENDIVLETEARNTSENFWNIAKLIEDTGLNFQKFIIAQKPYTERRTFATALKRWPNKSIIISSINQTFEEYIKSGIPIEKIINMMIGEVERLIEYPDKGYMVHQYMPESVMNAYNSIKNEGYDERKIMNSKMGYR